MDSKDSKEPLVPDTPPAGSVPDTPPAGPSLTDVMNALTALSESARKQERESLALRSSVEDLQFRMAMGRSVASSPARSTATTPRSASPSEEDSAPRAGRRLTDVMPHLEEELAAKPP
jgi:hypothetical protein